jgi:uncharacterized protein (DUF305 family)
MLTFAAREGAVSPPGVPRRLTLCAPRSYYRSMPSSFLRAAAGSAVALLAVALPQHRAAGQAPITGVEQARRDSIRRPYTAADIEFMSGMIGHHAQAVKMAGWAESHGASKSLQIYCDRVAMAQTAEIGLMQTWLKDRNQPVPVADARGMKMSMGGTDSFMMMPGMLTETQMAELDAARGMEWDRLFLTFMIQHHKGAITMVDTLFNTAGAGQDETVFKFANDVQADQSTEIDRMQQMLDALPPRTPRQDRRR